ncbi:hypothetical protein KEM09_17580 [Carboxylicivirga mesophila]|uniref:POTRA domain-containing protein n=1 Tax=Carboxylicivirga mesophila TaxID=1166478 RepID=A0ABS5KE83_9BACT|nr:hypothetical protein [Carboxylicivirga mesophila]MBS2213229.1 hypothetical protein [Carboxylicivirga mesophila]
MNNPQKERKAFITRTILISTILIAAVTGTYLYYFVLVFNAIEHGKVYGESTVKGGRYEVYTLKYYYQHNNSTYFDKVDYVIGQELQLGDSIAVRVLKPYPPKHMVDKVYRDDSKRYTYDCKDGFLIRYNEHINTITDYEDKASRVIQTSEDNAIHLSDNTSERTTAIMTDAIDNIKFNMGSLVDYYIIKTSNDTVYLHAVYHYLNDFSTDAMPSKILHQQLNKQLTDKHIHISVVEKDNPKKEFILDKNW